MSMPASSSVQVWDADFRTGFLPQVSPLSGAPASARKKLTYRTAPRWTLVVIVIGILLGVGWIPGVLIRSAVQKSSSGYLFVTSDESRRMRLIGLVKWGLLLLAVLLFIAAGIPQVPSPGFFVLAALAAFGAFIVCLLIGWPRVGPKAVVTEPQPGAKLVTFQEVNSPFVEAVQSLYASRSNQQVQTAAAPPS
jgi:hypothetical protein